MLQADDFEKLKRRVQEAKTRYDQTAGKEQQLLAELKQHFGITSVTEGRKLLQKKIDEQLAILSQYNQLFDEIEREFPEGQP